MLKRAVLIIALLSFGATGCTIYVRPEPPAPRKEVRSARPHNHAVWVAGHWKWKNQRKGYKWVPGHWERRGGHGRH